MDPSLGEFVFRMERLLVVSSSLLITPGTSGSNKMDRRLRTPVYRF